MQEMNDLTNTAETEKRAFTPEEDAKFDELEGKVRPIDTTPLKRWNVPEV